jgi:hypothetical protein
MSRRSPTRYRFIPQSKHPYPPDVILSEAHFAERRIYALSQSHYAIVSTARNRTFPLSIAS